ncbi:MAG: hypothetical protein U1F09_16265 [Steroidobacteraceae bacterium]
MIELRAREHRQRDPRAVVLAAKTARLVRADGSEADVLIEDVKPGDVLRAHHPRREGPLSTAAWSTAPARSTSRC